MPVNEKCRSAVITAFYSTFEIIDHFMNYLFVDSAIFKSRQSNANFFSES